MGGKPKIKNRKYRKNKISEGGAGFGAGVFSKITSGAKSFGNNLQKGVQTASNKLKTGAQTARNNLQQRVQSLSKPKPGTESTSQPVNSDVNASATPGQTRSEALLAEAERVNAEPIKSNTSGESGESGGSIRNLAGINEAFIPIYKLLTFIIILLFVALTLIGFIDLFKYASAESTQELKLTNSKVFLANTHDNLVMKYLKIKSDDDEPYSVNLSDTMISYILVLAKIFIGILLAQYCLYLFIYVYSKLNEIKMADSSPKPPLDCVMIVIVCIVGAFIISSVIYKNLYVNKTVNALKSTRDTLKKIKDDLYSNITTNVDFLNAMINDDITTMNSIFNDEINKQTCTDPYTTCDNEPMKMIFTLSLYGYYTNKIPNADINFDNIKSMFKIDNIRKRNINPYDYFYYKQHVYIPNEYMAFVSSIQNTQSGYTPFFTDSNRENSFMERLSTKFEDINKSLIKLNTIASGKEALKTYMGAFAAVTLLITIIIVVIYVLVNFEQLKGIFQSMMGLLNKNNS
jgi:hypothetical protein